MNKETFTVRKMVRCAVVAAIYVALCLGLAPFSYGAVQVRVAEALCLLPIFGPEYILGVTLGCALANLLGSTMIDVVFGTLATFLACLCTYAVRRRHRRHRDRGLFLRHAGHPGPHPGQRPFGGRGRDHQLRGAGRGACPPDRT